MAEEKPTPTTVPFNINKNIPSMSPLPWMTQKSQTEKIISTVADSCLFKGGMSGAAGS
jgi:hypothetical protein